MPNLEHKAATLRPAPTHSRERPQGPGELANGLPRRRTRSLFSVARQKKNRSKLKELPANIYENKGPVRTVASSE